MTILRGTHSSTDTFLAGLYSIWGVVGADKLVYSFSGSAEFSEVFFWGGLHTALTRGCMFFCMF